jgi:hypothetical protein
MKSLILISVFLLLGGCTPSQSSSLANGRVGENSYLTQGTSSGGGSCTAELSCRFTNTNQTSLTILGVVAGCGVLELVKLKDNQWVPQLAPVETHRWTIYREDNEYVLLFKRKSATPQDETPWVQLEVKLEQKFRDGPNMNSYPATLSGEFKGLDQSYKNEPMICQPGWFKK